jgi:hypothetical protein
MTCVITSRGAVVLESDLVKNIGVEKYVKFKRGFTKTIKLGFNKYINVTVVKQERVKKDDTIITVLLIPRFLVFNPKLNGYFTKYIANFPESTPINKPEFLQSFIPRNFQTVIVENVIKNYFTDEKAKSGEAGVVVEVEAGLGKTFIASMIFKHLGLKTLYIVPNKYLLDQAIDDFKKCFGDTVKYGEYSCREKRDGDIIFMIINSVMSKEFIVTKTPSGKKTTKNTSCEISPVDYMRQFGLSIWDEVHEYASDKRAVSFSRVNTKYMLGLTAEANSRVDKLDFVVHNNCGSVLVAESIEGFKLPDQERFNSNITIVNYSGPNEYCKTIYNKTGMMSSTEMSKQLCRDPYRTYFILTEIIRLCKNGHNVFIWCDMRRGVNMYRNYLEKIGITPTTIDDEASDESNDDEPDCENDTTNNNNTNNNNYNTNSDSIVEYENDESDILPNVMFGFLMGSITKKEILEAKESQIIIATYQYAYRGVSLPNFDAMIMTTPRRAKTYQTLKRIFRMGGDISITREIIDIVDIRTKLKKQKSTRMEQYKKPIFNATITNNNIDYSQISLPADFHNHMKRYTDENMLANPEVDF